MLFVGMVLGNLPMNYVCVVFHRTFIDFIFQMYEFLPFHVLNSFHTNFTKHSWKNAIHETFMKSFS